MENVWSRYGESLLLGAAAWLPWLDSMDAFPVWLAKQLLIETWHDSESGRSDDPLLAVVRGRVRGLAADSVPCQLAGESDSGSKMGATARSPVRSDAVSVTACSVLNREDTSDQPTCTRASAVRIEALSP
jgi:hypothetical protein